MPILSNEYCSVCDEMVVVEEQEFMGGVKWVCIACGHVVDCEYDDDEIFPEPGSYDDWQDDY
jgi:hypothetical protein